MPSHNALIAATKRCFHAAGQASLDHLQSLLAKAPSELMAQCVVIVQQANALLEEEATALGQIFLSKGKPIVCNAGCTGCCRQVVLCQPFEARMIHDYLVAHPEKMAAFRAAYALWDASTGAVRRSYVAWAAQHYGKGHDDGSHVFEDYNAACPFLDAAGLCAIYAVRPYGCRTCIAVDAACTTPEHHGAMQMQFSLFTPHHALRMQLTTLLLQRLGAERSLVPMPEVLASLCL